MISFRDVSVQVEVPVAGEPPKVKTLLSGVNLDLAERRVSIIGPNGSGKSTLLRLMNGLVEPASGQVLVEGVDTKKTKKVRKLVGFVFPDSLSQLLLSTPLDDVQLSLKAVIKDKNERRPKAMELLESRGLGHVAEQSIYDLSGGERQLAALTSILALEPKVVVADEPTTALDLKNRYIVNKVFDELEQQVIYATHDMEWAERADYTLVVSGGRIVASGNPADCVAFYKDLVFR
ncbi:MAG: energy-coupling factor ABC transporter ATP-binding protein [Propionibacteriaceae bacterium]|jgi:biotin transport system ATP-binding protein|nr:energy-coupling factor ABC transporter ATP-binding protein [Propionibacteriaceae bacterium]